MKTLIEMKGEELDEAGALVGITRGPPRGLLGHPETDNALRARIASKKKKKFSPAAASRRVEPPHLALKTEWGTSQHELILQLERSNDLSPQVHWILNEAMCAALARRAVRNIQEIHDEAMREMHKCFEWNVTQGIFVFDLGLRAWLHVDEMRRGHAEMPDPTRFVVPWVPGMTTQRWAPGRYAVSNEEMFPPRLTAKQVFEQEREAMRIGRELHRDMERRIMRKGQHIESIDDLIIHDEMHALPKREMCKACTVTERTHKSFWCKRCEEKRKKLEAGTGIAPKFSYVTPGDQSLPSIVTCDLGADWED